MYELTICRGCGSRNLEELLNLGKSPIAHNFLIYEQIDMPEVVYPLILMCCTDCAFVQLSQKLPENILFNDMYLYFSSYSTSWLEHSKIFAQEMKTRLKLDSRSLVVEIASNDGYLLDFFKAMGISTLGIEPSRNVAEIAIQKGIATEVEFFTKHLAKQLKDRNVVPDLIVANNVLAHVPDIHDFISGIAELVTLKTVVSIEFPHLVNLMRHNQFDTIYHEHYSYLSITSLVAILDKYGLKIFDLEELDTHGGSLRLYIDSTSSSRLVTKAVKETRALESIYDPRDIANIKALQENVLRVREELILEIRTIKQAGQKIALYGAAAKGNTLLNFCGVSSSDIEYAVDANPNKQNRFLPGTHIAVYGPEKLQNDPVDVVLILPWNLGAEINSQLREIIEYPFVTFRAIPKIEYY